MAKKSVKPAAASAKVKLNLSLDAACAAKLRAYAGFKRLDVSEVVAVAVDELFARVGFRVFTGGGGNATIIEPASTIPPEPLRIASDESDGLEVRRVG